VQLLRVGTRLQSGIIPIPNPRFAGDRGSIPIPIPDLPGIGDHPHPRFPSGVPCPGLPCGARQCHSALSTLAPGGGHQSAPVLTAWRQRDRGGTGPLVFPWLTIMIIIGVMMTEDDRGRSRAGPDTQA
jgi:hypothetical protein